VGIGFYLSNFIGKPAFALLFILISATLYLYASSLKQSLLVGNIIVALLTSISVIIIGIFNLYPLITFENRAFLGLIFRVLLDYAIFAFVINFIREIVKDLEDVNGDYNQGMNTLPIALGVTRTARLTFALALIPAAALVWYIYTYIFHLVFASIYSIVFIAAPMGYFLIKMWYAASKKDFAHLSLVLKLIMFFGILSILVISLNMKYHA